MVDVILAAALGAVRHVFRSSALGAHEEHAAAAGGSVTHGAQRAVQHGDGLLQVYDVDLVAHAEQERPHTGVPAAGVVAEMDAGLEELAQGEIGHRHGWRSFPVVVRLSLRGGGLAAPDHGVCGPRKVPRV